MISRRDFPARTKHSSILDFLQGDAELEEDAGNVEGAAAIALVSRIVSDGFGS